MTFNPTIIKMSFSSSRWLPEETSLKLTRILWSLPAAFANKLARRRNISEKLYLRELLNQEKLRTIDNVTSNSGKLSCTITSSQPARLFCGKEHKTSRRESGCNVQFCTFGLGRRFCARFSDSAHAQRLTDNASEQNGQHANHELKYNYK